eukprot:m.196487 g.196487  ORF g.196487 m.196487 type:complete len:101 (+) comp15700_c0_seq19:57-359(+)
MWPLLFASLLGTEPIPPSQLLPYPPMHWHSWNTFCGENEVNEQNMRQVADALISTGMADAGYTMVNVVCNGWTGRNASTGITPYFRLFIEYKGLWFQGNC